jgi:type IV pilus assembly protein PilZ
MRPTDHADRVQEFAELERRRTSGTPPLELAELTRWQQLREQLEEKQGALPDGTESRRGSPRVRTHLKMQVSVGAAQRLMGVYNLSEGGVFLETERPLEVGSQLCIAFAVPGRSEVELEGRVAWIRPSRDEWGPAGMGVELAALSEWDRVLVAELVEAALLG